MKQETNTKDKGAKKSKKSSASKKKVKVKEGMSERKERTLRVLGYIK